MWCTLMHKLLDKLHPDMSYSLFVSSLLMNQQYLLNTVLLNRSTHRTNYVLVNENVVTRGFQEPNLVFPLGTVVQYSLIQCSCRLSRT